MGSDHHWVALYLSIYERFLKPFEDLVNVNVVNVVKT